MMGYPRRIFQAMAWLTLLPIALLAISCTTGDRGATLDPDTLANHQEDQSPSLDTTHESSGDYLEGNPCIRYSIEPIPRRNIRVSIPEGGNTGSISSHPDSLRDQCRERMCWIATSEFIHRMYESSYTDLEGLIRSGVYVCIELPSCPSYEDAVYILTVDSVNYPEDTFIISCPHDASHGSIVGGQASWNDEPVYWLRN